jgi:hypothetical protein
MSEEHAGRQAWTLDRLTGPVPFTIAASVAGLFVLVLGAGMTFFSDEWAFIESRSLGDPVDWFRPHNEHWSTLPIILYRLMVETIGIGSYMPYLAVVVALNVGVACVVYRLVERRSGCPAAFLAGMIVALFGSGFENLFWGFQSGFVASVLFGLAALDVTDGPPRPRRVAAAIALLVLSLLSSGQGLVMCVLIGLDWLLDDRWRRHVPWLAIPAAIFVAWYLAFGRYATFTGRSPWSLAALSSAPWYAVRGLGNAAGAVTGLGPFVGVAAAAGIAGWTAVKAIRRTAPPVAVAALGAIVVQYSLIGMVRGNLFAGQIDYTRYTYVAGILLLVAVSALAGRPRRPASAGRRFAWTAIVAAWVTLIFVYNGALLVAGRELFLERADRTRALLVAGQRRPLPPETDPNRTLVLVPSPAALQRITASYGDGRSDSLVPWAVRPVPPDVQQKADDGVRDGIEPPAPEG